MPDRDRDSKLPPRPRRTIMKPAVEVHTAPFGLVAEFWESLKLDPAPIRELRTKYEAHLDAGGRPIIVVDMLGVAYALSLALGQFVTLQKFARSRGGTIIFCNVDLMVQEVFRISKLEALFEFATDRAAAIERAAAIDAAPEADEPPSSPAQPQATTPESGPASAPPAAPPSPRPARNSGGGNLLRRHRRGML
jgi:anti-anti-sigma factor